MHVIKADGINDAYRQGMDYLGRYGIARNSRYGSVLVAPGPVTTHYTQPNLRVLFHPQRDANPTFHLIEALWMLTGANDTELLTYLVPRVAEFSDNGSTFHAAYGHRWRHWQPDEPTEHAYSDQLDVIVDRLRSNPEDRRCILQMWDPARDLGRAGVDFPCNVSAKLEIGVFGNLNMVVFNRSNDIVLGCYGANIVQFSILQEYLAARIGVPMGWLEQVSTNFHAYINTWHKYSPMYTDTWESQRAVRTEPLVYNPETFDAECARTINILRVSKAISPIVAQEMYNPFFHRVVEPMMWAYGMYRNGDPIGAHTSLEISIAKHGRIDWLVSAAEWMARRGKGKTVGGSER